MKDTRLPTLVGLLLTLFFWSCTTVGTYVEPEGPSESVAVVRGTKPGFFAGINPLRKLAGDTEATVWLVSVDGEPLTFSGWSGWPIEIRVTPGPHAIGVKGRLEAEGTVALEDDGEVSRTFQAGRTYQVDVDLSVGGLRFVIDEVRDAAE